MAALPGDFGDLQSVLAASPGYPVLMRAWLVSIFAASLLACSATQNTTTTSTTTGGAGEAGSTASAGGGGAGGGGMGGATSTGASDQGGFGGFGGQGGGAPIGETEVFGHSASTLYKLDPVTKQVTVVGDFSCANEVMIDIALDKAGNMVGTTFGGLHHIDKTTAACTLIKNGGYPNSLSFVPAGTVDPNVEALVGFEGSSYVRIFTDTGAKQTIGALNGGYTSSGDVVSVIGGGTYLTVIGGPENCGDCIIEVDPKTGAFIKNIGPLGHSAVYGLAFWGGAAYGFDSFGELFQIDLTNGSTVNIAIPGAPPNLSFYGAGSSTSAPVDPPE